MIIPVLCQTCGRPIAHLWSQYRQLVAQYRDQSPESAATTAPIKGDILTPEERALRTLQIDRDCCRIPFMCTLDLSDVIS